MGLKHKKRPPREESFALKGDFSMQPASPAPKEETASHAEPQNNGAFPEKKDKFSVFEFFFSKLKKTIPEAFSSAVQKIAKLRGAIEITIFNWLPDVIQARANIDKAKKENNRNVQIEAEKKLKPKTDALKTRLFLFEFLKFSFDLVEGIFDWVRQIQDTKAAIEKVSKQPKGEKNYFDVIMKFAKMPFLALQNLVSISELVALISATFENFVKNSKALKWLLTGIAYLGGHVIGFAQEVQTVKSLYRSNGERTEKENQDWNQALRNLIKHTLVLVVSILVVLVAIYAFKSEQSLNVAKNIRPFVLAAMTAVDGVFKYLPHFFEGIRDFGFLAWRFITQIAKKGFKASWLEFKNDFSKDFTIDKKIDSIVDSLKAFGRNFRDYHETKQANVFLLEGKKTAKKVVLFSFYALLTVVGFVGSLSEFLSAEFTVISGIAMPLVLAISSALFLFSSIFLVKHCIEYQKADDKDKTVYLDKIIAQAVKMLLTGLVIGLCIWAIAAAAPAVALYAIATTAALLFYGYIVLNRKFSEKEELYGDFELKEAKPEKDYVEANKKTPCLYLETKTVTSEDWVIKCDIFTKGEVKSLTLDLNRLGKYGDGIIYALRQGIPLTEKHKEMLFEELTAQGCHRWGRTEKALWPAEIRKAFQRAPEFISQIAAEVSHGIAEAFHKLPFFKKAEIEDNVEEKKDASSAGFTNSQTVMLNLIENSEKLENTQPEPPSLNAVPELPVLQNQIGDEVKVSQHPNSIHNETRNSPVPGNASTTMSILNS